MSFLNIKIHPGIVAALLGGLIAFLLSQFQLHSWTEQAGTEDPGSVVTTDSTPAAVAPTSIPSQSVTQPQPVANGLRVRNQTPFPIRLVLLENRAPSASQPSSADAPAFQQPVHWDFAPAEGSADGLILSLPDHSLRLQEGDILVGFALDGSRRYWGPFVVARTPSPEKSAAGEWQLTLQP
jgi:hypothetical protein